MRNFLILLAILLVACKEDPEITSTASACSANDPVSEVGWVSMLKNSITNCSCLVSVIRGTYDGETVFFTAVTDPLCNVVATPILYDCDGNKVKTFTESPADQEDLKNLIYQSVLYTCEK